LGKYGDEQVSKLAQVVVLAEFFELTQSGADGRKSNQISSLQMTIEELKL